ncbi:SAM-dependent chlorinase/fluorinase [Fischerella sp. JS2]|uniref:SAM hydrolase/SAM-dependent halogenase family protein n=1 Tax=Fischerella sp. JS2 TaxID=2597771 RepID=UPI0028EC0C9C|nr:SAM-dependent chlorinase/fluorinase [Fischerella sp. JS2]
MSKNQEKPQRLLTLLSDFGDRDVYVGVMKGAIAQINPKLKVIDLTHQIPPQNIVAARFCLMDAYPYFPEGTVHVAVVDPGVGGQRRAIAVEFANGYLVGPDNGLFSGVLTHSPVIAAMELTNPDYWRTSNPSTTFHGRDIFAPVGAHLASGVSLQQLGTQINPESLVKLKIAEYSQSENIITGCIQYIDHFGNLVSNIPGTYIQDKSWSVLVGDKIIPGSGTYGDVEIGDAIALVGSHGWVELAINSGNARSQLQMNLGDTIQVVIEVGRWGDGEVGR